MIQWAFRDLNVCAKERDSEILEGSLQSRTFSVNEDRQDELIVACG
jgi:hypothetical protein